eukprot:m.4003 g.4003  ORF g.4003 m.4003 type:complete len:211 (-) comp2157_c0_seq1:54-686(-)
MSDEKQALYPNLGAPSYQTGSVNQNETDSPAYQHQFSNTVGTSETDNHAVEIPSQIIPNGDGWDKYLGPTSEFHDVFNEGMKPVHVDFKSTFPQLHSKDSFRVIESIRTFNGVIYEFCADVIDVIFSIVFGIIASIFVGIFMGMTRTFYTYMVGPFIKWTNLFVSILAPSWRAFFRAMCDPLFESASLTLSNVQVRLGMEANARHKAIQP